MTTDFCAALQKLLNEVHDLRLEAGNPSLRSAVTEARAALAEQPVMPTDEELREMFNENNWNYISPETFEDIARAVLARWGNPAPQPTADGEVAELVVDELTRHLLTKAATEKANHCHYSATLLTRAADLLQRQYPQPVPVSERLPKPEDCNVEGRCWFGRSESEDWSADWTLAIPEAVAEFCEFSPRTVWLPFHALPLPEQEVSK